MKKTLLLALALTSVSLAGCTDEGDTTVAPVVPVETVTPPIMTDSTTMMDNAMGAPDSMGTSMEGETMMADTSAATM